MKIVPNKRFWAVKILGSLSVLEPILAELEKIGAFNVRYDSLDDQMFLGNIPDDKESQLRKYLKNIGCTNIRTEK